MAYKFQLGAAKMSGSLVQEGALTAEGTLTAPAVSFADVSGLVGAGLANNSGVLDISSGGVTNAMLSGAIDADKLRLGGSVESAGGELDVKIYVSGGLDVGGSGLEIKTDVSGGLQADENGIGIKLNNTPGLQVDQFGIGVRLAANKGLGIVGGELTTNGVLEDLNTLGVAGAAGQFIVANGAGSFAYQSGATARSSLGLAINTDVQAYDAGLADIAGLAVTDGNIIVGDGTNWVAESGATARSSLGLGTSDSPTFAGLTVNGDLTVTGSLTYINTTNLVIEDALITVASGAADLASLVAAGAGIEFGSGGVESFAISGDIDGFGLDGFASSLPISASAFIGNGSALTGITADAASSLVEGFTTVTSGSAVTLDFSTNKIQILDTTGGNANFNLPAASTAEGEVIKLKKTGDSNFAVLSPSGSQTVDGDNNGITLESPYAAVMLVSNGSNWFVF